MQKILIVGCGYTGLRLAGKLQQLGARVAGTARSEPRIEAMRDIGVQVIDGALGDEKTLSRMREFEPSVVVYFVPPQKNGPDPLAVVLDGFCSLPLEAFIYASATSVYGDRQGNWVDEDTAIVRDGVADEGRINAEETVRSAADRHGLPGRICRISGIYGPGRTLKGLLQSGHYTLIAGHDSWVGRIHVDDLVAGIIAAWQRGQNGQVYNMVDQRPHLASEFANLAADLNHLPRPKVIDEAEARGRYSTAEWRRKTSNKRIRCAALIDQLGVELKYPTFELGLPAAVAEDRASND